jgi:hypothetical protein
MKSKELQIGKAGEYIVCADLIIKGFIAYLSEQGLPYDVVIDNGKRLLKCQVKTTSLPRKIPQRNKDTFAYIFNIKRHGKNNIKKYLEGDVDLFALVELETRTVGYLTNANMPETINLRVDRLKGTYYDEKGLLTYEDIIDCKANGFTQTEASKELGISVSTVNKMWKENYKPFKTNARYFSELIRKKEWFYEI